MSKKPIRPERRKVNPPTSQDVKLVSCAVCERELIGRQHAEHAHLFGIPAATFVLDRPYCFGCSASALQKTYSCTTCKKVQKAIGMVCQAGKYYCGLCAEPAPAPWRGMTGNEILRGDYRRDGSDQVEHFATENSK